jgi:cell division cycle 14
MEDNLGMWCISFYLLQVGAYLVLFGGVEAEAAYQTLSRFQPFMPFRDPTCGISTYHLSVYDCIQVQCFPCNLL